jgi:RNA polymerase sigma-70 factor (ECF subfamily)
MKNVSGLSDAELVKRIIGGDEESFSVMVEQYSDPLCSIAFLITRNAADARDVVQQAFFEAYQRLPALSRPERLGAWLRAIVTNLAHKVVDRRVRAQRFHERVARAGTAPDPADQFMRREKAQEVLRALEMLSEVRREIVVLYYLHKMKVEKIARLVGKPSGSVKRMLAEARDLLRKELIEMAREEFKKYRLTREQRERLAKIGKFPRTEPSISITRLEEKAKQFLAFSVYGSFAGLSPGCEASFADYDYPGRKLTMVTHVRREGPIKVKGKLAFRSNSISFTRPTAGEKVEGVFYPYYYRLKGDMYLYCAKQYCCGQPKEDLPLLTPEHTDWKEPRPKPESLRVVPGSCVEPDGDWNGRIVDTNLYEVKVGRRSFRCVRRASGGGKIKVNWSRKPVTGCATEEFFLTDGRLLLWRRYNGLQWSKKDTRRAKLGGVYERLAQVGTPMLKIFGEKYYLWYNQIPHYAIQTEP